VHLLV